MCSCRLSVIGHRSSTVIQVGPAGEQEVPVSFPDKQCCIYDNFRISGCHGSVRCQQWLSYSPVDDASYHREKPARRRSRRRFEYHADIPHCWVVSGCYSEYRKYARIAGQFLLLTTPLLNFRSCNYWHRSSGYSVVFRSHRGRNRGMMRATA